MQTSCKLKELFAGYLFLSHTLLSCNVYSHSATLTEVLLPNSYSFCLFLLQQIMLAIARFTEQEFFGNNSVIIAFATMKLEQNL